MKQNSSIKTLEFKDQKILFLDINGVLNSEEYFQQNDAIRFAEYQSCVKDSRSFRESYCWPFGDLSESLIKKLNIIIESTDCSIVLSSSWRTLCTLPNLRGWLAQKGFNYPHKLIDFTTTSGSGTRGKEIRKWLNEHQEVMSYAILDDNSSDITGKRAGDFEHPDNFVETDFAVGLQDAQVSKVIEILNRFEMLSLFQIDFR